MKGFRWTIKRKLFALGAGTLISLLLLIAIWVWWQLRDQMKMAGDQLRLASQQAAGQVEEEVRQVRDRLDSLTPDAAFRENDPGPIEKLLRLVVVEHPEIENVFSVNAHGVIYATAVPRPGGASVTVADRSWFQQTITTDQPTVGDFETSEISRRPVAFVAVPLGEESGVPSGVLAAALSLQRLEDPFRSLSLPKGMTMTVLDGSGRVLFHRPDHNAGRIGKLLPSASPPPLRPTVVPRLSWFDGEERLAGMAPVGGTGWRVIVGIPRSLPEARVWKDFRLLAIPLGALLAVTGLIGFLIARRIWRPLQALAEAARGIPQGEKPAPIPLKSTDEVGELAEAFRTMTERVKEFRLSLERRVEELTTLFESGRLLTGTLELPDVLERLAAITRTTLGVDLVHIWLLDLTGEFLTLEVQHGAVKTTTELRRRLDVGEGFAGLVAARRAANVLDDIQEDPRVENRKWLHAETIVSLLGFPLCLEDELLGVLSCLSRTRRHFTREEIALGEALATQAVVAIRNADQVGDLRQAMKDLKSAQEQLARSEALRATGEMAAGMAHHLNNILAVIRGRVQLLLQQIKEPSQRRSLEIAEDAVAKGAEVIRRVSGFSRTQSMLLKVPVDLNRLAEEALEQTKPQLDDQARGGGIRIETRFVPGQIPLTDSEPEALREALACLLRNAMQSLPAGGTITLKTWVSGSDVLCSVTDNGEGMSEEVRRRALEPFFTTRGPKSTGLGLSVVHGIIRRNAGKLDIESVAGKGTTVTIGLPVTPEGLGVPPPSAPAAAARSLKILIIDDEPEILEVLSDLLTSQGHLVSKATSGVEGISLFQDDTYDVVFTDLGMPAMDGRQVARKIKTLKPGTPVILVTGWADKLDPAEANAAAVDQVISKPFNLDAIVATIARALEGRAA